MDWSHAEVEAIVADHFEMLEKELWGIPYNKRRIAERSCCD